MTAKPRREPSALDPIGPVVIRLLKGVLYRRDEEKTWHALLATQPRVSDYVREINLQLEVDEAEGFAYLLLNEDSEETTGMPQLVARRQLSYYSSLLLALLRKRLVEFDAEGGGTRLVLTRDQIVELIRVYLPEVSNEVKLRKRITGYIGTVVDLGFMRRMSGGASATQPHYEVLRIIKKFVDAEWLATLEARLEAKSRERAGAGGGDDG